MLKHYDTPDSPLAEQVRAAMTAEAPTDYVTATDGTSYAHVRLFGGHVLTAHVTDPTTGVYQELLYPGGNPDTWQLQDPKIRASHFGAPVGPDGFGVGNKHGAFRYATYERVRMSGGRLLLRASLPEVGMITDREVTVGHSHLDIVDALEVAGRDEATSLLNHLYLKRGGVVPSGDNPMRINGETLDDVLRIDDAGKKVANGEPFLWTGFGDVPSATITMPDGSQIAVAATINGEPVRSALLWSPRGEDAFCIEPVDGVGEDGNRGHIISAGQSSILAVTITAIRGAAES